MAILTSRKHSLISHETCIEADTERDEYLESLGLKILRFSNSDVDKNFYEVCTVIDNTVKERMK